MPTKNLLAINLVHIASLLTMVAKDYAIGTSHTGYFFNLGMALTPVVLLYLLKVSYNHASGPIKPLIIFFFGTWLLFFPNAVYLVIDPVLHVKNLLDLAVYFPSIILGIMIVVYCLKEIEDMLMPYFSEELVSVILATIFYITSFGLYLGLVGRWNSWDLFIQPVKLLSWAFANVLISAPFCLASIIGLAIIYFLGKKILNPSLY